MSILRRTFPITSGALDLADTFSDFYYPVKHHKHPVVKGIWHELTKKPVNPVKIGPMDTMFGGLRTIFSPLIPDYDEARNPLSRPVGPVGGGHELQPIREMPIGGGINGNEEGPQNGQPVPQYKYPSGDEGAVIADADMQRRMPQRKQHQQKQKPKQKKRRNKRGKGRKQGKQQQTVYVTPVNPSTRAGGGTTRAAPPVAMTAQLMPFTKITNIADGIRLHCKFIWAAVTTSVGTPPTNCLINLGAVATNSILLDLNQTSLFPGNFTTQTGLYQKARLKALALCYQGECSSATAGSIAITFNPDPSTPTTPDNTGAGYLLAGSADNSLLARVWDPCTPARFGVDSKTEYFVHNSSSDVRLTSMGIVTVSTKGLTASTAYGSIWMEIVVDLFERRSTSSSSFDAHRALSGEISGSLEDKTALLTKLRADITQQIETQASRARDQLLDLEGKEKELHGYVTVSSPLSK